MRGIRAELDDEFARFRGPSPNGDRVAGGFSQHRSVREPNGIPVGFDLKKKRDGKKRNQSQHVERVAD